MGGQRLLRQLHHRGLRRHRLPVVDFRRNEKGFGTRRKRGCGGDVHCEEPWSPHGSAASRSLPGFPAWTWEGKWGLAKNIQFFGGLFQLGRVLTRMCEKRGGGERHVPVIRFGPLLRLSTRLDVGMRIGISFVENGPRLQDILESWDFMPCSLPPPSPP